MGGAAGSAQQAARYRQAEDEGLSRFSHADIVLEYLDVDTPVDTFKCCAGVGCEELDDFIRGVALDVQEQSIALTVVALHNDNVVGYITYGIDGMIPEPDDARRLGVDRSLAGRIPALRIRQLAVGAAYDHNGIGTRLVRLVFDAYSELCKIVPCPQIIVDSYPDAVGFYEKLGFRAASDAAQRIGNSPCVLMIAQPEPMP